MGKKLVIAGTLNIALDDDALEACRRLLQCNIWHVELVLGNDRV